MTCQMQLQRVAMQVTGHLPFTPMLLAGRLHGHLHVCSVFWYSKLGNPGKVEQLWQLTRQVTGHLPYICYQDELVAYSTKCSVYFNQNFH